MDARTEHRNSRRSPTPLSCDRLFYGGEMDILSALKNEASKLQKQLDTVHAAIKVFGGRDGVGRGKKRRLSPSARARIAKAQRDRKSTRLNSSHGYISYAVFCLHK